MALIDRDSLLDNFEILDERCNHAMFTLKDIITLIDSQPEVNVTETAEYEELCENFVDYVCSGVTNPAIFCKNKFAGCVNKRGWCADNKYCRGFKP